MVTKAVSSGRRLRSVWRSLPSPIVTSVGAHFQSGQNLGAGEAHPAVGADAVGAQPLGQAEAGRKEPVGQGIVGQHDRLTGRADLDLMLGQQHRDLVRHEPHIPIGFLDELTGLGAIQDIEQSRVLSHTAATPSAASSGPGRRPPLRRRLRRSHPARQPAPTSRVIGAPPAMTHIALSLVQAFQAFDEVLDVGQRGGQERGHGDDIGALAARRR